MHYDDIRWLGEKNGELTVKSLYRYLEAEKETKNICEMIEDHKIWKAV